MSALKRKNLASQNTQENDFLSATALPFTMQSLPSNGEVYPIDLDRLMSAPIEWNFYRPLPEDKMLELIDSIQKNGLLHPVVVWEREGNYIVLSGHNRIYAYRQLWAHTKDAQYKQILCAVKKDITESIAREIIIDSNWISRSLTVSEKTKSIYQKYVLLSGNKEARDGKHTYDHIAESYGLSGRQIHRYLRLQKLIPPLLQKIDQGSLSLRSGVILSEYDTELQKRLYGGHEESLTNQVVARFKKNMNYDSLVLQMEEPKKMISLSFEVPEDYELELRKAITQLITDTIGKKLDK